MNMPKSAKDIDDLKDEFLSNVSHDLKIPLSIISGYCDLLIFEAEKDFSKKSQLKGLNIIKEATIRLSRFIEDVLDLTKLKSEKLKMELLPIHLDEIVCATAKLFETAMVLHKKEIILDVHDNLPMVLGDSCRIKQVILNLLYNAFESTKAGDKIIISVRLSKLYCGRYVEVCVADTSAGISEEDIKMLFEKFYQIKKDEHKRDKSSGLGLSIAYEIIKLHNGRIWAKSEIGKGVQINFVLPISDLKHQNVSK